MLLQNWWYTTTLGLKTSMQPHLNGDISADYLVIGGGMTGVHAAYRLRKEGHNVVLVEKTIIGGDTTGKSAGFLTPDSELELYQLIRRFGVEGAKKVWDIPVEGIKRILETIHDNNISCDLQKQDSVFLGIGETGKVEVEMELEARKALGLKQTFMYGEEMHKINTGEGYTAALQYTDTYGINPLQYMQEMKKVLLSMGVTIYESTRISHVDIQNRIAHSHYGNITAKKIVICIDKMKSDFLGTPAPTYSAQTFVAISEPLDKELIKSMFPTGNVMCWDSKLVYSYYRLLSDDRLLLGGGEAISTFLPFDLTTQLIMWKVIRSFKKNFPMAKHIPFVQYWPGRIDTTRDIMPIVQKLSDDVVAVHACVGLPWAAFCGQYAADLVNGKPDTVGYASYLSANKKYAIKYLPFTALGKMIVFALNNGIAKYKQKGY